MDFEADIVSHELVLVMDKFTAADVLREVSVYDTISKAGRYTSKVRGRPRRACGARPPLQLATAPMLHWDQHARSHCAVHLQT